jgi:hypothetical protein
VAVLELVPERSTYDAAEPVKLHLAIKNTSNEEVRCTCALIELATISFRLGEGEFRQLQLREGVPHVFPFHRLQPSDAVRETVLVAYDLDLEAPPFDRPGLYELRAVYFDRGGVERSRLESATVRLRIKSASDRAAYKAYSRALAKLSQLGIFTSTVSEETIAEAGGFVNEFGSSVYAAPLRGSLVRLLEHRVARDKATALDRELLESIRRKPNE